ncbi:MAG: VanZ family protein [Coriobacteriales bacterium]|nr:VanZ family protein [Coriobacteriales bacterium]
MLYVTLITVLAFGISIDLALFSARLRRLGKHSRHKHMRTTVGTILLVVYVGVTLWLTLLSRNPKQYSAAKLELFWSYREALELTKMGLNITNASLLAEIILNVLLFVPLGALLPLLWPSRLEDAPIWKAALIVAAIALLGSAAIELSQWYFKLGLFEFDDLMDNTIGAVLGFLSYRAVLSWRTARARR